MLSIVWFSHGWDSSNLKQKASQIPQPTKTHKNKIKKCGTKEKTDVGS